MAADPLDIEQPDALAEYLRATGWVGTGEALHIKVLAGGVSNRTVLVERPSGEAWVLKQALPKLRVAVDWFSDPRRIEREAMGLRWLAELAPPGTITPLVFEDPARHLLAMAAVPQPHENWKAMLLAGRVETGHVEQFGALLGAIHRRAAESESHVRDRFSDRSFFESLRLEPYYLYSAEQVPEVREFLLELVASARVRRLTLVHGDYSPKNVLVQNDRLILLDHEVIHWGDPAFDAGFALTHLLSKAHHLPQWRDAFVRAASEFCDIYKSALGPAYWDANLDAMIGRHTLGCLLARAVGRSPLEYLTAAERAAQRDAVIRLMARPPATALEVVQWFIFGIANGRNHTVVRP